MRRVSLIRQECRRQLLKIQASYTVSTNQNRELKPIDIGQRVYAKLPSKQNTKLDLPISGPFRVVNKKGKAWILLELN